MIFQGRYSQHLIRWDLIAFYIPFSIRSAIHIQFPYECAHLLQAQSCPWDSQCLGAAECAQPPGTPLVNQLTPPSLSLYTLVPKSECTIRQWLSSFPDASLRPLQLRRGQQDEVWIAVRSYHSRFQQSKWKLVQKFRWEICNVGPDSKMSDSSGGMCEFTELFSSFKPRGFHWLNLLFSA